METSRQKEATDISSVGNTGRINRKERQTPAPPPDFFTVRKRHGGNERPGLRAFQP